MFVDALPARMVVCSVCALPTQARRGVGSPGAGFTGSCELPCGCLELGLGPIKV